MDHTLTQTHKHILSYPSEDLYTTKIIPIKTKHLKFIDIDSAESPFPPSMLRTAPRVLPHHHHWLTGAMRTIC